MSLNIVLTADAEDDLDRILLWSHRRFGELVRVGYEALIVAGIEDVANSPMGGVRVLGPNSGRRS